jgi:Arc/MetJ-type ribon-helix-helix transcriptional regulator
VGGAVVAAGGVAPNAIAATAKPASALTSSAVSLTARAIQTRRRAGCNPDRQTGRRYTQRMTIQVPVRLTEEDVSALDAIVASGRFANRSEALRAGLEQVLRGERENAIDGAYRRGYGAKPQAEWLGEVGLAGLAAFDRAEGGDPL